MHLASRQIFTGSGRIIPGVPWPQCLGLSQRQPFVQHFIASNTVGERSIVNSRNRPYADPARFARLHVICGDANRAHWSNVLKYGTSRLVLAALEDMPEQTSSFCALTDPVGAFLSVRNKDTVLDTSSGSITPLGAQRLVLEFVRAWHRERSCGSYAWAPYFMDQWERVLDLIERNDDRLQGMLDYFLKKKMFEEYFSGGSGRSSPKGAQALEYRYHLVGSGSLFDALCGAGWVEMLVREENIRAAITTAPKTRAAARSKFAKRFGDKVWSSWHIASVLEKNGDEVLFGMLDPRVDAFSVLARKQKNRGGSL